jgi:hypothetical protein
MLNNWNFILDRSRNVSVHHYMQTRYFTHTDLYPVVLDILSVAINQLDCEGDHSTSSNTEVYNVPIFPICLHVTV